MTNRRFLVQTQCFPPQIGGIETVMGGLAETLAGLGHQVVVRADGQQASINGRPRLEVHRYGMIKPLRRILKRRDAHHDLSLWQFDAVFCDSWKSAEGLRTGSVPMICLAHGNEFLGAEEKTKRALRIRKALANVHAIAANSHDTESRVRCLLDDGAPVAVVHPPVQEQPSAIPAEVNKLRTFCGDSDLIIATLCRLEPRKGVDRLIESLAELLPRFPNLKLFIAGCGADRPRLEKLASNLSVAHRCIFLGKVDQARKSALFQIADIFAMPCRRHGRSIEGYGLVYLEAAQFGLPALAGRSGGAPEAVLDGETGLLCEGTDVQDVAAKLNILLGNAQLRRQLGDNAKCFAELRRWRHCIHSYLNLISRPPTILRPS